MAHCNAGDWRQRGMVQADGPTGYEAWTRTNELQLSFLLLRRAAAHVGAVHLAQLEPLRRAQRLRLRVSRAHWRLASDAAFVVVRADVASARGARVGLARVAALSRNDLTREGGRAVEGEE